jgi:hypothetical protein
MLGRHVRRGEAGRDGSGGECGAENVHIIGYSITASSRSWTVTAASMYFPKTQKTEHGCKVKEKSEDVLS